MGERILRLLPSALLVGVFAVQFVLSRTTELSPWKGGGFGMYTEVHFGAYDVWVRRPDGRNVPVAQFAESGSDLGRAIRRARRDPSEENLRSLAELLARRAGLAGAATGGPGGAAGLQVQVWRPVLDRESLALTRELVARYPGSP